jgi:hypothetical protein
MLDRLFVVLGAGASHACTSEDLRQRIPSLAGVEKPPLVTGLFSPSQVDDILRQYPQAQAAGADIRRAGDESLAIEDWIRENYRDSDDPADRVAFASIAYYLQHLLLSVSDKFRNQPDNYDLLIRDLLRKFEEVVFITLNYDTLLDRRLHERGGWREATVNSYISDDRWSLIKLHGSVNWGRGIRDMEGALDTYQLPPTLLADDSQGPVEVFPLDWSVDQLRTVSREGLNRPYFPALAVPAGPSEQVLCPDAHLQHLEGKLHDSAEIDLLVIGYSGTDQQIVRLLNEAGKPIRSLVIVDRDLETSGKIADTLSSALQIPRVSDGWPAGFESFVQAGGARRYIGWLEHQVGRGIADRPVPMRLDVDAVRRIYAGR